jgi:hypothetical protein
MSRFIFFLLALFILALGYLLLWPVPINPQSWEPTPDTGYVGVYAPNNALSDLERLDMGEEGPEDIAIRDGLIYASSQTGKILTYDLATGDVRNFADTGGIPLGIEFDDYERLLVADAAKGLLRIDSNGKVETLLATFNNAPIVYADDVDVASDGTICFSDASTKFGAVASGGTMEGSLLEIMEHGRSGRVICTDSEGDNPRILIDNLTFPNGVAFTPEDDLLINVTGTYATLSVSPDGVVTPFAANYPGFPDNINPGPLRDGQPTYLIGLVSPRSSDLDAMANKPFMRKIVQRLPASFRPAVESYAHLIVLSHDGRVLASYQDPTGAYASVTGGLVHAGQLYLSSLTEHAIARRPVPDLLIPDPIFVPEVPIVPDPVEE